ncbi:syntabulin isoform X3 [Pangasianodon hypophthalmus]|uniref:syntabulin isoform X3 n=1 Tax=Pangasianodon hypophthalmus TaxID=310915 RepID=UPI0023070264|nr:syntabulin isoform X3 [Pangasianodon hypophthalmus]
MGPFQDYKVKKSFGKDSTRSRIPRLMLQPFHPKDSQISQFPLSEDESKDCDISRKQSRTISPNSFSSDDTGCPSSQCPSPAKIRSGSDNSSLGSPIPVKSKAKVKRVRVNVVAECNGITQKHNREQQQPAILHRGSEADFSSSSSTGSFKSRGTMANSSTGKKSSLSHSRVPHIRSQPVFKPPGSPTAPCDAELYAPYRTPPKKPLSSCISNNSNPTVRRTTPGSYRSCGDNHGIRPPNPEQYLTPLQQKEVTIRHLRTKLRDSEQTVSDRESEIQELKSQLGRMREDWIEEECHRVEAQLALKEARKEIKQLRQVVETMKNSLMEKDKGIQKYFIDINIQNRKLESLLHSMELAQSGANLHDEPTLDFICDSPEKPSEGKEKEELQVQDQAEKEMADSGLLVNDEMANQMDMLEQVLMSTAVDYSQDGSGKLMSHPGVSSLIQCAAEDSVKSSKDQIHSQITADEQHTSGEKAVQTDETFYNPDLQALLLHLLKLQNTGLSSNVFQKLPKAQESNIPQAEEPIKDKLLSQAQNPNLMEGMDHIPYNPALSTLLIPQDPGGSTQSSEPEVDPGFMEELDFGMKDTCSSVNTAVVGKSHWSNSFLVDLVAVAAPVLPTVAWLYSQHNAIDGAPVYNIAALIRGCCIMGLHSLRLVTYGPHV